MRRRTTKLLLLILFLLPALYYATRGVVSAQTPELVWPPDGWTVDTVTPTVRWRGQGYPQLRVFKDQSPASYTIDRVLPQGQDSYTLSTDLEPGTVYKWKVRINPLRPEASPLTWEPWSEAWSFSTPGEASWSSSAQAGSLWPTGGGVASSITPTLSWTAPPASAQYELVMTPEGNEAARTSIIRPIASDLTLPGPPTWYGMLPGTLYYWRIRVTNVTRSIGPSDPSWGTWSQMAAFRTPVPTGDAISSLIPDAGRVDSLTPTLVWRSAEPNLFYYEIQVSSDPKFITDATRSIAPVYWEVKHGGVTTPPNSYTVPAAYSLKGGAAYYWRVRPVSFGPAGSVPWSKIWSFTTPND